MSAVHQGQDVSIPFDAAGVDELAAAQAGSVAGASGVEALAAPDLQEFRDALTGLRQRAENATKQVVCTANWTERSCNDPGAAGVGRPAPDKGVTVILTGAEPGSGTINPATGSGGAQVPGAVPESPGKPQGASEDTSGGESEALLYYPEGPLYASAFHRLGKGDGLLMVPGRGIFSARALLDAPTRDPANEGRLQRAPVPLLDLWDESGVPVGDGRGNSCRTFGANPQVVVLPPANFHASVAVDVKGISVVVTLTVDITPVRASFGRTGRCWEGVCSREQLTGFVVSTVAVKASVRATGAIKIGRFKIGVANIAVVGEVSAPRLTAYTLDTG